jgi:hypothetical protein
MTDRDDRNEDDDSARRADRLRRRIADVNQPKGDDPGRRPGESDAEYVQRRMRELSRKPSKPGGSS